MEETRALFNAGFSAGHFLSSVPSTVDDVLIFCDILGGLAETGMVDSNRGTFGGPDS